jgi:hypothetical protein
VVVSFAFVLTLRLDGFDAENSMPTGFMQLDAERDGVSGFQIPGIQILSHPVRHRHRTHEARNRFVLDDQCTIRDIPDDASTDKRVLACAIWFLRLGDFCHCQWRRPLQSRTGQENGCRVGADAGGGASPDRMVCRDLERRRNAPAREDRSDDQRGGNEQVDDPK